MEREARVRVRVRVCVRVDPSFTCIQYHTPVTIADA